MRFFLSSLLVFLTVNLYARDGKPLTLQDVMKFRAIEGRAISDNGTWVVFSSDPDYGDAEGVVRSITGDTEWRIERGERPQIAGNGSWAGFIVKPPMADVIKAGDDKKKKKELTDSLVLVNTANGEQIEIERVKSFAISDNGGWAAWLHLKEEPKKKEKPEKEAEQPEEKAEESGKEAEAAGEKEKPKKKNKQPGTMLVLHNLASGEQIEIPHTAWYGFDPNGRYLVHAVSDGDGAGNGLFYRDLNQPATATALHAAADTAYSSVTWQEKGAQMAFLSSPQKDRKKIKGRANPDASLHLWKPGKAGVTAVDRMPNGWAPPHNSRMRFTKDGKRLFFGMQPIDVALDSEEEKKDESDIDLFDPDRILKKRTLDVWHTNDPLIKTNARKQWNREKNRTWLAVVHLKKNNVVPLATKTMPSAQPTENEHWVAVSSDIPYRRQATWNGGARDWYVVNIADGTSKSVTKGIQGFSSRPSISPDGKYAVWFDEGHYHLMDLKKGGVRNLTQSIDSVFANELHDYPSVVPGYGVAGWLKKDKAVYLYDRYDIWEVPTEKGEPQRITQGRENEVVYRFQRIDPDRRFYTKGEKVILNTYYDKIKNRAFHSMVLGQTGTTAILDGDKVHRFVAKAKKADQILFTREDFQEFPDLWTAKSDFSQARKLTNENPQAAEFGWGEPQLVSWTSTDGVPLQGALFTPAGYKKGQRVPVLVYYYRFFSQRVREFNRMEVNHRPNFPYYTSNGYAVFLPDVRFKIGLPGESAVNALVPGVQKIIDMGIADPDAIGLHGHSWSGYQTAFAVTRTNIFACAVSGAPVSNMTSAYSGIRLGSGLARQFQYEKTQSRIGASMWERRDLYVENSPVFFADRIETPTLIMFGDIDDAVPWEQGIELYLAMRRLDKDVIFLQYRGEPHHLKKYGNKLDYTIKMKEYLDHHLKGEPAPEWMTEGVPYLGK